MKGAGVFGEARFAIQSVPFRSRLAIGEPRRLRSFDEPTAAPHFIGLCGKRRRKNVGRLEDSVMRISGGEARGIPLVVPKGDAVRPATDGMRQAVFSSLAQRLPGAWFLDWFAGSGAYGLEALSRGAAGGHFVEKSARAVACLRQNIAAVCKSARREPSDLHVTQADVLDATGRLGMPVPDIVFIDPPYDVIAELAPKLFAKLGELLADKPDPVVVFEMPGEIEVNPEGWTCVRRLGKGNRQPTVAFFRKTPS
jgi:16S rRNA (guanine966-N2)-methyltransferase